MSFKLAKSPSNNIKEVNADTFATQIKEIQKILQNNMFIVQANYECYAN